MKYQAEEVFARASALPWKAREAFLDAACAGDDALRHEVRQLLLAMEQQDAEEAYVAFAAEKGVPGCGGKKNAAFVG